MTYAKLLCGVRVQDTVHLSLTADALPPGSPPTLTIHSQQASSPRAVPYAGSSWTVVLDKGDHVLYLPVTQAGWFDGALSCQFSAPVTLVVPDSPSSSSLKTWTSNVGITSDPKNPWPPPHANALSGDGLTPPWLRELLTSLSDRIAVERSG